MLAKLVLSYHKETDTFYFTSLKMGQTFIRTPEGCGNSTHFEIYSKFDSEANTQRGFEYETFWFYTFDEEDVSWNDFLKLSGATSFEDILSRNCTLITRHPKSRFYSGVSETLMDVLQSNFDMNYDEAMKYAVSKPFFNWIDLKVENTKFIRDFFENQHLLPINRIYLVIRRPHHKVVDISELKNLFPQGEAVNVKNHMTKALINGTSNVYDYMFNLWIPMYNIELHNYNKLLNGPT